MKHLLVAGAVLIVVLVAAYILIEPSRTTTAPLPVVSPVDVSEPGQSEAPNSPDNGRLAEGPNSPRETLPLTKLKVSNFTGQLEEVNTSCFSDGECYVVVDGKRITTTIGWSQKTVGTVQGVDGFGDLESHIGRTIEVYAQDNADGTYTLYGNEGFYIKLLPRTSGSETKPKSACIVGGCSSQLCVDATKEPVVSTCEWREVYACYQTASCARQDSGECGWSDTPELKACINGTQN